MTLEQLYLLYDWISHPEPAFFPKLDTEEETHTVLSMLQNALKDDDEEAVDTVKSYLIKKGLLAHTYFTLRNAKIIDGDHTLYFHQVAHPEVPLVYTGETFLQALLASHIGCAIETLKNQQRPSYPIQAAVWWRASTGEWVLELSGTINDTAFGCRHTQPGHLKPEDVAGLPELYA